MRTLDVELGERSYPIYIGQGLLKQPDLLARHISSRQVMVVSNETIAPLYLDTVLAGLSDFQTASVVLPDGERHKTLDTLNLIFDALLMQRYDRRATLLALGGGVVGDMTGFAAACYQRGISFVQLPTTLLSQVDSSVGGKTGVNHAMGKNMIGAFHQPLAVLIDTNTLNTLPDRELRAGLAEVVKYGLLWDADFLAWLEQNCTALLNKDADTLAYAIEHSCRIKAEIVAQDEKEADLRALLNLGHTFGHALETCTQYTRYLHGEAVAIGMYLAASLSARLGLLSADAPGRVDAVLSAFEMPRRLPADISADDLIAAMRVDKKARDGAIRLVLMKQLGRAFVHDGCSDSLLKETLQDARELEPPT
ncbi:MAG: 3-dehydroquinate synthase [Pseudomonadota bacterium]